VLPGPSIVVGTSAASSFLLSRTRPSCSSTHHPHRLVASLVDGWSCSLWCRRHLPAHHRLAARRRAQIEEESSQGLLFPPPLGQAVICFSAVLLAAINIICDPQSCHFVANVQLVISDNSTGVEIAGALKNVLAIAAGIVKGMNLGNNSMAALVSQGCSEIRWLATKMGVKPTTITGLSGTGDIMLTCFVNLSRNPTVGVHLGLGEKLEDILRSMTQNGEFPSDAGVICGVVK
ncbi:hypothetical protein HN873_003156, partial [Arachis hypogaea]